MGARGTGSAAQMAEEPIPNREGRAERVNSKAEAWRLPRLDLKGPRGVRRPLLSGPISSSRRATTSERASTTGQRRIRGARSGHSPLAHPRRATLRAYAYDLVILDRWLEKSDRRLEALPPADLVDFIRSQHETGACPRSINRRLITCHLFYRFVVGDEIGGVRGVSLPGPHYKGPGRGDIGLHARRTGFVSTSRLSPSASGSHAHSRNPRVVRKECTAPT